MNAEFLTPGRPGRYPNTNMRGTNFDITEYPVGYRDREEREPRYPPRAPVDLPTRPPFTLHLGNLAFDISEREIEDFFAGSQV